MEKKSFFIKLSDIKMGKINARAECGGIQRTQFYKKNMLCKRHGISKYFHLRPQRSLALFGCRQL